MALTGQLSDMSLAELIEFFCNQRKTGRLKIDYPRGHSVFFIKEGELVDAKVGALSGPEAVYFSLTLPNAAFDFSPDVQATRRTIDQAWTQVVLEGLRRLDEGVAPTEADAFGKWEPSETELAQMFDRVEQLDSPAQPRPAHDKVRAARAAAAPQGEESDAGDAPAADAAPEPFPSMVQSAGAGGGSKKKFVLAGVAASVVLACAVAAVPLLNRAPARAEAGASAPAPPPAGESAPAEAPPAAASGESAEAAPEAPAVDTAAADASREERERKERERRRREEAAKREEAANALNPSDPNAA
ncbi:MAG TPA: DUF4388 domain-containing protein, partial [Pyrinomonadaceae bacterium]